MLKSLLAFLLALSFIPVGNIHPAFADESMDDPGAPTASFGLENEEDENGFFASGIIKEALEREAALGYNPQPESEISLLSLEESQAPSDSQGGMATTGEAHILGLLVDFPDVQFESGDDVDAFHRIINAPVDASNDQFPYESLQAYYQRASYGKLTITGDVKQYTAKNDREFYSGNIKSLFSEAMQALDDEIDFQDYDKNGDGLIDGVYLHFAGTDGIAWGTTWWSNATRNDELVPGETVFDDVALSKYVTLHHPSNEADAARTLIHETGHVLGLPDLYSYARGTKDDTVSGVGGVDTFDMMFDNIGDIDGFCKWMLGWLGEDQVTRIIANDQGVTVKRNDQVINSVVPGEAASVSLGAFTMQALRETGGIAVISTEDAGMFSSYYLAQYDQYAGNQSVLWGPSDNPNPLPTGFRLYRVQAALNEAGTNFAHTNSHGSVHNKLIELVDPDENMPHFYYSGYAPYADRAKYACMFHEGDAVSPTSTPVSTNFNEALSLGFTGLTILFGSCSEGAGALSVSYSSASKPDFGEFSLTLDKGSTNKVFPIGQVLTFTPSSILDESYDTNNPVTVSLDGDRLTPECYNVSLRNGKPTITLDIPQYLAAAAKTLEVDFKQGAYVVGRENGAEVYSPAQHFSIPFVDLVEIAEYGEYAAPQRTSTADRVSNTVVCNDGLTRFAVATSQGISIATVGAEKAAVVSHISVPDEALVGASLSSAPVLLQAEGSTVVVLCETMNMLYAWWIDIATGGCVARYEGGPARLTYMSKPLTLGNIVAVPDMSTGMVGYRGLRILEPDFSAGQATSNIALLASQSTVLDISKSAVAFSTHVAQGPSPLNIKVISRDDMLSFLKDRARDTADEALGVAINDSDLPTALASFTIQNCSSISDVKQLSDDSYVALASNYYEGGLPTSSPAPSLLVHFDKTGVEIGRTFPQLLSDDISMLPYASITLSESDLIALTRSNNKFTSSNISTREVQFFDSSLAPQGYFFNMADGNGSWRGDAWFAVGRSVLYVYDSNSSPETGGQKAEDDPTLRIHYDLTKSFAPISPINPDDPAKPDDPAGSTDPDDPADLAGTTEPVNPNNAGNQTGTADSSQSGEPATAPSTGDTSPLPLLAIALVATLSLFVSVRNLRKR